jgi:hypothetical protein
MTDKKNGKDEVTQKREEARTARLVSLKKVRAMKSDSDWNVLEEIIQDVMATYVVQNPDNPQPAVKKLREDSETEIKLRYESDHETRDVILEALPSEMTLGKWIKQPKWNEAVWDRVRTGGLFTKERRSQMINSLFERGVTKSDNAAKIWLTLSGDYSEKLDITQDRAVEKFREINEILLKKKKES